MGNVESMEGKERRQVLCIMRGCEYSFSVQAKVTDFGLLKSVPSGEELADQGTGVAGTPGYLVSPPSLGLPWGECQVYDSGFRVQGFRFEVSNMMSLV